MHFGPWVVALVVVLLVVLVVDFVVGVVVVVVTVLHLCNVQSVRLHEMYVFELERWTNKSISEIFMAIVFSHNFNTSISQPHVIVQ